MSSPSLLAERGWSKAVSALLPAVIGRSWAVTVCMLGSLMLFTIHISLGILAEGASLCGVLRVLAFPADRGSVRHPLDFSCKRRCGVGHPHLVCPLSHDVTHTCSMCADRCAHPMCVLIMCLSNPVQECACHVEWAQFWSRLCPCRQQFSEMLPRQRIHTSPCHCAARLSGREIVGECLFEAGQVGGWAAV
jgi:hypothetical protein